MKYNLRIKNLSRQRLAGLIMECTRLLTVHGTEETFGLDLELSELPEMYQLQQESTDEDCDRNSREGTSCERAS